MYHHRSRPSALFDQVVEIARRDAARILGEAGVFCQCGHLMHGDRCSEPNLQPLTPGAYVHAFCRCDRAKRKGEPDTCAMKGCERLTEVDQNGRAGIVCKSCMDRVTAAAERRLGKEVRL